MTDKTKEPQTYWEQRCAVNEYVLNAALNILSPLMTERIKEEITVLYDEWDKAIEKLNQGEPPAQIKEYPH